MSAPQGPDKRTAAYQSIFGRPNPAPTPPPTLPPQGFGPAFPPGSIMPPHPQRPLPRPNVYPQPPQPRWNGPVPPPLPPQQHIPSPGPGPGPALGPIPVQPPQLPPFQHSTFVDRPRPVPIHGGQLGLPQQYTGPWFQGGSPLPPLDLSRPNSASPPVRHLEMLEDQIPRLGTPTPSATVVPSESGFFSHSDGSYTNGGRAASIRSFSTTKDARSDTFTTNGSFSGASGTRNSSVAPSLTALSSITSAQPPLKEPSRRGPLVYPALLSKVAEAFRTRVTVGERVKDGLTYQDAFDGREAVDRIAYIIKTSDRNLALLLGRALDAQKFFHDVTYDHRLRDSPNEIYQFRTRIAGATGLGDGDDELGFEEGVHEAHNAIQASYSNHLQMPGTDGTLTRNSTTPSTLSPSPLDSKASLAAGGASSTGLGHDDDVGATSSDEDEDALPTGVFTLLTDCYSPTCTRDRLCYSIACPRRLEQQARLNMKPQAVLKRSISRESLADTKVAGALWSESVSKAVFDSVSETERKRQEAINEVIYTERDFVRDLEYLRDYWMEPLRKRDIIPIDRREEFVEQVFWNVLQVHAVNAKLAEMLSKRQKQQDIVQTIGEIFLEVVPSFQPFVKYGSHQLYAKYEFEKEKGANPAFAKFVDETERLPESRKLELNGYLTKPTTRLARYPLLLEQVVKYTADDNADKQTLPRVIKLIKEFLAKVNIETGKSENRFNLAQLDQQLAFKQGEAVDLRLRDEQREMVFKGPLKKRAATQSESAELQVFLFDHALLMVKQQAKSKTGQYRVYRKPIPLELLIVTIYEEATSGKGGSTRPRSVMSRTSTGNRMSSSTGAPAPKQDAKTGYALTFEYLGRKGYTMTLWASTFASRKKWFEHIEARQEILRQRSNIFDIITLSENFFIGQNRVTCSVPFDFGRRIIYGTDDGVYLSDLRERARPPTKVLPLPFVTQVEVLEEYQILIVLAERQVHTFTLDALDPTDPLGSLKRGRRISQHTSFFRAGTCLGRTLVCTVKSSSLSSTIKTLEPIEPSARRKQPKTFKAFLQGPQDTLKIFKEFYIPTESSSIHFLKTKLCVGCTKGFEIVDLETLDTQGLLDPADSSLDFVQRRENVKPMAIYRIDKDFLLCYDEFAFYVNKNGWRSRNNWIVHWEGYPTSFALHMPYILAFEPKFIEVRHVDTGALHQVITGVNLRCLFADVPPQSNLSHSASTASISSSHSGQVAGIGSGMGPYGGFRGPGSVPPYGHHQQHMLPPQAGPGPRPPIPGHPPGYPAGRVSGGVMPGPMVYPGAGGPMRPGMPPGAPPGASPYGYNPQMVGPPVPVPSPSPTPSRMPQRNPVWESVSASRGQVVFIGDTTVFCIRLASSNEGGGPNGDGDGAGRQNGHGREDPSGARIMPL
ncbi:RHO1 GDP-GTP exchange protein 2 [Tilletia horrida]|uniref:RHO1 GDP-GTP exchange protein 2 n=1 Tax=Tilletia horrida TaxID=155126 RepID=A0AAN6GPV8_9BASI|nr:RHO1 GDP-GTP exchange protein 2 [Tilletia horrida]